MAQTSATLGGFMLVIAGFNYDSSLGNQPFQILE